MEKIHIIYKKIKTKINIFTKIMISQETEKHNNVKRKKKNEQYMKSDGCADRMIGVWKVCAGWGNASMGDWFQFDDSIYMERKMTYYYQQGRIRCLTSFSSGDASVFLVYCGKL